MPGSDLVLGPQQAVVLIVDAGPDEVHAVVLNAEVEISKPEHRSGWRKDSGKSSLCTSK